jgi:hypothetical protein
MTVSVLSNFVNGDSPDLRLLCFIHGLLYLLHYVYDGNNGAYEKRCGLSIRKITNKIVTAE